jgi:homospermidine synthase
VQTIWYPLTSRTVRPVHQSIALAAVALKSMRLKVRSHSWSSPSARNTAGWVVGQLSHYRRLALVDNHLARSLRSDLTEFAVSLVQVS